MRLTREDLAGGEGRFRPQYQWDVLCDPGTYPARVAEAEPGVSGAGNAKLVVVYEVDTPAGGALVRQHAVKGWLRALLGALGLDVEAAELDVDPDVLVGRDVRVVLQVEPERDGFPARMTVRTTLPVVGPAAPPRASAPSSPRGDRGPF